MDSHAMENALFWYPRHIFELTAEKRKVVNSHLLALYNRLQGTLDRYHIFLT